MDLRWKVSILFCLEPIKNRHYALQAVMYIIYKHLCSHGMHIYIIAATYIQTWKCIVCLSARSTLSLIVNILTAHPVSSQLEVNVTYGSYKSFNPYWFPDYAGRLARFQQAKETLDDQV